MNNTKAVGNVTEAMVLAALTKAGHHVLIPWGDNLRYDLALDNNGSFVRVQCKTGRLQNGAIVFSVASTVGRMGTGHRTYADEADMFGVYCPETDGVYLVPVVGCGNRECSLRVTATKNNQRSGVRLAADYLVVASANVS